MALMISVSGIRGIYGTDLNPENIARFAAAFGTWAKGGTIVVGRDSRVTGPVVEQIVVAALRSVGCDVITGGIIPTPTVAMGVLKHGAAGGIVISASHNPAEWNALKLLNEKSEFLDAQQGAEVIRIAETGAISYVDYTRMGKVSYDDRLLQHHIDEILNLPYIHPEKIRARNFHIALDAVNGAGSTSIPTLLNRLGVSSITSIHCVPDGLFPHNPEPLPEHLTEIKQLVIDHDCDLGIVVDPDADRLALVASNGELFGEEYTLGAMVDFMLGLNPGPTAANLSSSSISDEMASKYGQTCVRAAVGEINVVKAMQANGCVIGGEGNGGVINPDLHYGRDALVGIAMMLQHLANLGMDSATYRATMPNFYLSKNKVTLEGISADDVLAKIAKAFAANKPNTIDGVKLHFEEGWVHLRKSNTEPIIRIYSEARSQKVADELAQRLKKELLTIS